MNLSVLHGPDRVPSQKSRQTARGGRQGRVAGRLHFPETIAALTPHVPTSVAERAMGQHRPNGRAELVWGFPAFRPSVGRGIAGQFIPAPSMRGPSRNGRRRTVRGFSFQAVCGRPPNTLNKRGVLVSTRIGAGAISRAADGLFLSEAA